MKKYLLTLLVIASASFAKAEGIACSENNGPFGGALHGFKLAPLGNGYFELTYTSAKADGSNAKTISVAKDLKCEFSKMDPVALECRGDKEINTQMHYSNYILVTKNVMTIKNSFTDGVYTSYELTIAAPEMSDDQLKMMADFNPTDPSANPNLNNRSFKASFTVRDGLSGCKAL